MPETQPSALNDSLGRLTQGQRILSVLAEMHRASNWMKQGDLEEMKRCYARALEIMDCLCELPDRPKAIGELRRWRELVAGLYVSKSPSPADHHILESALVWLHPESWNAFFLRAH